MMNIASKINFLIIKVMKLVFSNSSELSKIAIYILAFAGTYVIDFLAKSLKLTVGANVVNKQQNILYRSCQ